MLTRRVYVTDDIHKTIIHNFNNVISTLPKYLKDLAWDTKAAKSKKYI